MDKTQYRIIKHKSADKYGNVTSTYYTVQYKSLLLWFIPIWITYRSWEWLFYLDVIFSTEESAKIFIQKKIDGSFPKRYTKTIIPNITGSDSHY